jgi:parvulin-like peptidyl-prolyl isomerase
MINAFKMTPAAAIQRLSWLVVICLVCALGPAACKQTTSSRSLATIDGKPISMADYRAQAAFMGLGGDPGNITPEMRKAVLESLVRQQLVSKRARELSIELMPEELTREEARLRRGLDQASFEASLAAQGISYGQWQKVLARELLIKKTLDLALASQIVVGADEVRQYYKEHKDQFNQPDQVLAQHAVLPTRELAKSLVERVAGGEDMVQAASDLGAPLADEGQPNWLSRGHMPEALEKRIFALAPGKLAGPMSSDYGFHVVRVLDKRPARKADLSQAAEKIQRRLAADKMEVLAEQWINDLRGQANLEFNQQFLESGRIGDSGR